MDRKHTTIYDAAQDELRDIERKQAEKLRKTQEFMETAHKLQADIDKLLTQGIK